jgi:copper(I)-binding protein
VQPPRRLRRAVAAVLVAAVLPALSGCASGFDSPVLRDYNPVVGVNVRDGEVWAMNMLVVLPESGRGTLVGALLNKGNASDRLVGATVSLPETDESTVQSTMERSSITLAPEQLVELSDPTTVAVEGDVLPGRFVDLTLQFQRAEPIQVKIPVVDAVGPYEEVPLP